MLAALLLAAQAPVAPPPLLPVGDPACRYDRTALLALDEDAFDQDITGGWRALSSRGCELSAADLIRDYRSAHRLERTFLSYWHEGQLRADAGQTRAAAALFARARQTDSDSRARAWNLYVVGSIAFLQRDRRALQGARDRLAILPKPDEWDAVTGPDGKPSGVAWPMNLNVLDGLLRCFDKPYRVAYAPGCSAPMMRVTAP